MEAEAGSPAEASAAAAAARFDGTTLRMVPETRSEAKHKNLSFRPERSEASVVEEPAFSRSRNETTPSFGTHHKTLSFRPNTTIQLLTPADASL